MSSENSEHTWQVSWAFIRTIVDTLHEPFLLLDKDLRVTGANDKFYSFFKVKDTDTLGKKVYELGAGQWDTAKLRSLLEDILPNDTFFSGHTVDIEFPDVGRRVLELNGRQIYSPDEKEPIIMLAMVDVTAGKVAAEGLAVSAKELQRSNDLMVDREIRMKELKEENAQLKEQLASKG